MRITRRDIQKFRQEFKDGLGRPRRCENCQHVRIYPSLPLYEGKEGVVPEGYCGLIALQVQYVRKSVCPGWQSSLYQRMKESWESLGL